MIFICRKELFLECIYGKRKKLRYSEYNLISINRQFYITSEFYIYLNNIPRSCRTHPIIKFCSHYVNLYEDLLINRATCH